MEKRLLVALRAPARFKSARFSLPAETQRHRELCYQSTKIPIKPQKTSESPNSESKSVSVFHYDKDTRRRTDMRRLDDLTPHRIDMKREKTIEVKRLLSFLRLTSFNRLPSNLRTSSYHTSLCGSASLREITISAWI